MTVAPSHTSSATARGSALERRSPMKVWTSLKISTASFFTVRSDVTIMGFLIGSLLHASMLAMETFLLNRPCDSKRVGGCYTSAGQELGRQYFDPSL